MVRTKKSGLSGDAWVKIIGAGVLFTLLFGSCGIYRMSGESRTIIVTSKERVSKGEGDSRYMVFTPNGTYQVSDSWTFFRFNSSDTYGKLVAGKSYKVYVAGWRFSMLSWYENIIEIE